MELRDLVQTQAFSKSASKSWRGPCPVCGGSRRFVVYQNGEWPFWFGACDLCGHKEEPYKTHQWPEETLKQKRERQIRVAFLQAEEKRIKAAELKNALSEFSTSNLWDELNRRMTEEHRNWWLAQGIPYDWQQFWRLGFTPSKRFNFRGELHERPAYTIPIYPQWADKVRLPPVNMHFRLVDPPAGCGKYRRMANLPDAFFIARPDQSLAQEKVFLVEGAKKAMVTHVWALDDWQVIGLPSANAWGGIEKRLSGTKEIVICLDPDTFEQPTNAQNWSPPANRLAMLLKQNTTAKVSVLRLHEKIDDVLVRGQMLRNTMREALLYARAI